MNSDHSGWNPVIFLYGPPGVGKSCIGGYLAHNLDLPFVDLDEQIEIQAGASIPEIFTQEGEDGFRQRESRALAGMIDGQARVVALGGGTLLSTANRRLAESSGLVVLLSASLEVLQNHLRQSQVERPLLGTDNAAQLPDLLRIREAHYLSFPLQLDVGGLSVEEAAWQIQVRLGSFSIGGMYAGRRSNAYPVRVIPGGLARVARFLDGQSTQGKVVIVSDSNVAPIYGNQLLNALLRSGRTASIISIAAGEASKTLETASELWRQFLDLGLDRSGLVVALGGGMVTDLAGFAASLYLRGVPWVAVPTTLLGMVDASLGGKTGVNLPHGKNLVGSFYPPVLVLADPDMLSTLLEEEFRSGMAEVVKHGVIADPELFALCSQGMDTVWQNIGEVVRRAMAVKVRVVIEDPFEAGKREVLNLGHTLGHALEKASGYNLRHGEAVSLGMAAVARFAASAGYLNATRAQQICAALDGLGLPTRVPEGVDLQSVERLMYVDKKTRGGRLRFVIPLDIGSVRIGVAIDDLTLLWEAM